MKTNNSDRELDKRLRFDAIQSAEDLTGLDSHKTDLPVWLGMMLMQANGKRKAELLTANLDSTFHSKLDYYEKVLAAEGFEKVLEMDIPHDPTHEREYQDRYFIYWHPDGLLLSFDSYGGDSVNGGNIYFNFKSDDPSEFWKLQLPVSGGGHSGIVDSIDCREAIRYYLGQMRAHGTFLNPWEHRPFLWLLHYMDTKTEGYDYKAITEERIAMLPEHVRKAITPKTVTA
jgi:hypothetical protein